MEHVADDLINVPILKNLIKQEIDRSVINNLGLLSGKLQKLENDNLSCCVEVYGVHDKRLVDKKVRNYYLKKLCALLNLQFKHVVDSAYKNNHIEVRLTDAATAREWQTRSCRERLKNYDFDINYDGPVKVFVAATHEHKQLLKKTRDALLPHYKYVSLCKNGVMVRQNDTSKIHVVKSEGDIYELLIKTTESLEYVGVGGGHHDQHLI